MGKSLARKTNAGLVPSYTTCSITSHDGLVPEPYNNDYEIDYWKLDIRKFQVIF